jgi:hypothetical protein
MSKINAGIQSMIGAHRPPHSETPATRQALADRIAALTAKNAAGITELRKVGGGKPDASGYDGLNSGEKIELGLAQQRFDRSKPVTDSARREKIEPGVRQAMLRRIVALSDRHDSEPGGLPARELTELEWLRESFAASGPAA